MGMEREDPRNLRLDVTLGFAVGDDAAPDQSPGQCVNIEKLELERLPVVQAARIVRVAGVGTEPAMLRSGHRHFAAFLDDEVEDFGQCRLVDYVVGKGHRSITG